MDGGVDDTEIRFEWHVEKSLRNLDKHGVTFDEASTVFKDKWILTLPDSDHSDREDRMYVIGFSSKGRLLTIVYAERGDSIRIISARLATIREADEYGNNRGINS